MAYYFSFIASVQAGSYNDLNVGDILELKNSTNGYPQNNPGTSNAFNIEAFFEGAPVGYAAEDPDTLIEGTMSAQKLQRYLTNKSVSKSTALLVKEVPFTNKNGQVQRRWLAEAFFVPVRQHKKTIVQAMSYNVGGTSAQNTKKARLMGELQRMIDNGEPINLDIEVMKVDMGGGQVSYKVFYPGETNAGNACGQITNPNPALEALFDAASVLRGKVTEKSARQSYTIEITPDGRSVSDFYANIDNAIARCVGQNRELEEKTTIMVKSGFSDEAICAVLDQMPTLGAAKANVPRPKQFYSQKSGSNLSDVVTYMLFGKMVRLVGEKGSGKNTLVETACWLLNRPLCRVQGSSELDKLDILGSRTLSDGNTGFELSSMLQTLRDDGVVVMDEANMIRPDVLSLLHSLTDGARSIDVPGYGPVKMGPHACILYTLNEDYVGTGEMNPATIDRGPSIMVKQETDMSTLLATAVPNAKKADIDICVKVSDGIRKAVRESGTLTADAVTIRGYIDALESAAFIPLKRALVQNVANKAQSESERTAMESIISSFCG